MSNQIQGIQNTQSQSSQGIQSSQASQVVAIQEQYAKHMTSMNVEKKENQNVSPNTVSLSEVREAVNELNLKMDQQAVQVNFDVDKETGRIVVQVKDVDTGDVLRQIPSEEMLEFARNATKGVGVTLDTQM
jgi:flagellar protein FlaG